MQNVYEVNRLRTLLRWRFNPHIEGAVNVVVRDIEDSSSVHDPFFNIVPTHSLPDEVRIPAVWPEAHVGH